MYLDMAKQFLDVCVNEKRKGKQEFIELKYLTLIHLTFFFSWYDYYTCGILNFA